jgi:shikimate dehydrogenase
MSQPWKLALLGDPVAHSRSPAMQDAAFSTAGIEAVYELIRCPAGELAERLPRLAAEDFRGLNLTVPLKEEGYRLLESLSPEAHRLQAVNTLRLREGGWEGHNSDLEGFAFAAREQFGDLSGKRAVLLGAGGAARAVIAALLDAGIGHIHLWNRSEIRAMRLMETFRAEEFFEKLSRLDGDPGEAMTTADLVIQATSLGLHDEDALAPLPSPGARPMVMDLITHDTPWLAACHKQGCKTSDGRAMLLAQGAAAFEYWTGLTAPREAMSKALATR